MQTSAALLLSSAVRGGLLGCTAEGKSVVGRLEGEQGRTCDGVRRVR